MSLASLAWFSGTVIVATGTAAVVLVGCSSAKPVTRRSRVLLSSTGAGCGGASKSKLWRPMRAQRPCLAATRFLPRSSLAVLDTRNAILVRALFLCRTTILDASLPSCQDLRKARSSQECSPAVPKHLKKAARSKARKQHRSCIEAAKTSQHNKHSTQHDHDDEHHLVIIMV